MPILQGHLALVTGATGGIGKATCIQFAKEGCNVAVHFNSAKTTANDLVKQLQKVGVQAEAFQADLRSYAEVCYDTFEHAISKKEKNFSDCALGTKIT
jgi:3-oxoacyl-[acyl-carrier protein] reductase